MGVAGFAAEVLAVEREYVLAYVDRLALVPGSACPLLFGGLLQASQEVLSGFGDILQAKPLEAPPLTETHFGQKLGSVPLRNG